MYQVEWELVLDKKTFFFLSDDALDELIPRKKDNVDSAEEPVKGNEEG